MKKIFVLFCALCITPTFANTVADKTIKTTHVNISSGYYFKTSETMIDPHSCGSSAWYTLKNGTYTKEAFSILLAAKMSGKKVTFYLQGCNGSYPLVDWINVHDQLEKLIYFTLNCFT